MGGQMKIADHISISDFVRLLAAQLAVSSLLAALAFLAVMVLVPGFP
jgi:hypothetical protein